MKLKLISLSLPLSSTTVDRRREIQSQCALVRSSQISRSRIYTTCALRTIYPIRRSRSSIWELVIYTSTYLFSLFLSLQLPIYHTSFPPKKRNPPPNSLTAYLYLTFPPSRSTKQATWSPPTNPKPPIEFSCVPSPTTTLQQEPSTLITLFPPLPPILLLLLLLPPPPPPPPPKKNTNIIPQQDPVIHGGKRMMSYPACHMCAIHWIR